MIPFKTCMKFNRKRLNRGGGGGGGINNNNNNSKPSSSAPPINFNLTSTSAPSDNNSGNSVKGSTETQESLPLLFQFLDNRLLMTLKPSKTAQRSIHVDPIALLDYSYHGVTDRFLENSSNWGFNSFTLDTLTGGHSLSSLLFYLFNKYNLISEFQLEVINVWKCFRLFENGYHDSNPFHNSVHAADVTQAMHCFIEEEKIGTFLTPMEKMCSLLAAVAHDLDHPGVNQHFLIATKSHLASLYNNLSVLESHHWRFAVSCLKESGIFSHFTHDQWSTVQFLLSSLILATDVTQQGNFLKRFRDSLEAGTLTMESPEDRLFIMQIALKCADLGNPCRPWALSKKWTTQICNEFYRQGDFERKLKMKVTPICDRRTASVARIQTDFFRNIVSPLFQLWDQFLGSKLSRRMMFNLKFNDSQWTNILNPVNVKRRHSYETMNEKKRKAKDISKSLDDIMLIEEISLDELKESQRGTVLDLSTSTSSPSSSSSGRNRPGGRRKDSLEDVIDSIEDDSEDGGQPESQQGEEEHGGEGRHVGKKQNIGPNGCGTPSSPKEKRCSLPTISISYPLSTSSSSSPIISTTASTVIASTSTAAAKSATSSQPNASQSPNKPTNVCSPTVIHSSRHPRHHPRHPHHNHHHHHHHHHPRHVIQPQQQQQHSLPFISVSQSEYMSEGEDDRDAGGDGVGGLPESSGFSTYPGLTRVVEQLINYEQSIDKVTCLPHPFSPLPTTNPSPSPTVTSTITPSYPSQSIIDASHYLKGRRGSAPGCIGIYTGRELATAALVLFHGTVSEADDDPSLISPNTYSHLHPHHQYHSSPSSQFHATSLPLAHLKSHSLNPSPTPISCNQQLSSNTSPGKQQQRQQQPLFTANNSSGNHNLESNKGQKRRSSFPVCDSGHYLGCLETLGGGKLNSRKSPASYLHGTAKSSSPRLKGRSLELLMSSLTAKTKLLTNQSCSLDSASERRSWLVKREERRGSIPQDILIHSLANYTPANAL